MVWSWNCLSRAAEDTSNPVPGWAGGGAVLPEADGALELPQAAGCCIFGKSYVLL